MTKKHVALHLVANDAVAWSPSTDVAGGFVLASGTRIEDLPLLIALWQLRRGSLIEVDGAAVRITAEGLRQLAEWERLPGVRAAGVPRTPGTGGSGAA